MMASAQKRIYRFGGFTLDATERRLEREGREIYLQPKTFDTLLYLVERHGSLVKKNEMMDALWADAFVTENALTRSVKEVREALEDDAYQPRFIKTVPRVGYKFIGDVEEGTIFKADQEEETKGDAIEPGNRAVLSDDAVIEMPAQPPAYKALPEGKKATGTMISHYRLQEELGRGGMGRVYKALDTKLNRVVVLKLLDPILFGDENSRARFMREARLASALDHPNICTIHEVGERTGLHYIAMQCLEAKTLKEVIGGQALSLDSFLSISLQVADALAAAHKRGIIHRDIKSSNIIITARGQAKVLDFGLANLLETEGGAGDEELTRTGAVLGTPSYMSPEQARGERADHRSDIFSFGVVMYEMATGRTPFKGGSHAETMSAVITKPHAPVSELNGALPDQLAGVIDRALAKDPKNRYQSIEEITADLLQVIEGAGGFAKVFNTSDISAGVIVPYVTPRQSTFFGRLGRTESLALVVSLVLFVGLSATLFWWQPWRPTPAPPEQRLILTFPGSHRSASFSPDSRQIAFINAVDGVPQVWIKSLEQGDPVQITSGKDAANRPRWSPLGDRIVYVRRSQGASGIWSVSPEGGTPQKIIENGRNPNWSWDGQRLVFERDNDIWTTSADGSDQRRVEGVPPTDLLLADRIPAFSPDGSLIAFFQKDRGPMGDYWIVPSEGGDARRLTHDRAFGGAPAWTPDGRSIAFPSMRAGSMTLWKMPLSGGQPEPVLVSAGEDTEPEISRDGRKLIYTNARNQFILTITNPATGETKDLTEWRVNIVDPSFSPREDYLLFFGLTSEGDVQLFKVNADGSNLKQVTRGKDEENIHPHWSADGSAIYFYQANPSRSFRRISINGGESTELVSGWEWGTQNHARVDLEGKKIVYSKLDREFPVATMIRDIESGREAAFTVLLHHPRWSPDGRFIVGADYSSSKWPLGDLKICPADGGPCGVVAKGYFPHWSRDGSRIYFLRVISGGREIWSVSSDGKDEKKVMDMRPIEPAGTFFDVAADGRIVWVKYIRGKSELWFSDFPGS